MARLGSIRTAWLGLAALLAGAAPGRAAADITFGLAAPLTGPETRIGAEMKQGMAAAIAEVNAQGGVLHQKLVLAAEDDGCDAKLAVAAATRLVERGIRFVFGDFCSAATLPASYVYAESGTLQITAAADTSITQQGYDGLFRLAGSDDQQGRVLADFVAERFAGKPVALLTGRSAYGGALAVGFRAEHAAQGQTTITIDQPIGPGTRDFADIIRRMKESGTEIVVFAGDPLDLARLVRQSAEAGLKLPYVSGSAVGDPQFWEAAGAGGEGTLFACPADAASLPSARDAVEQLQAHGIAPEGLTLYGYVAVQLFAGAIDRAQSVEPEAVAAELQKGNLATALGEISFSESGDNAAPDWHLCRWTGGHTQYVN
jgi:branched-chain amino acid transport system substrate-binding protein